MISTPGPPARQYHSLQIQTNRTARKPLTLFKKRTVATVEYAEGRTCNNDSDLEEIQAAFTRAFGTNVSTESINERKVVLEVTDQILVDPELLNNFVDKLPESRLKKPAEGRPRVDSILFKNDEGSLRLVLNTGDQDVRPFSPIPLPTFLSVYI